MAAEETVRETGAQPFPDATETTDLTAAPKVGADYTSAVAKFLHYHLILFYEIKCYALNRFWPFVLCKYLKEC